MVQFLTRASAVLVETTEKKFEARLEIAIADPQGAQEEAALLRSELARVREYIDTLQVQKHSDSIDSDDDDDDDADIAPLQRADQHSAMEEKHAAFGFAPRGLGDCCARFLLERAVPTI